MNEFFTLVRCKDRNPIVEGEYHTSKGTIFFLIETADPDHGEVPGWSCRDDRMSEEYPDWWMEEVPVENPLNKLATEIHNNAKSKGFFDKDRNIGEMLCLIHSEVSEALEADREGKYVDPIVDIIDLIGIQDDEKFTKEYKAWIKGTFEEEIADMLIRPLDLAKFKRIDTDAHVAAKMRYNSLREKMHGKKY